MIAVSPAMKQLLTFARRVAQSEVSTILLEGESGTGKDVLAQFLHYYGRRHEGPFVPLNCAAIPETLLESELFGYEKGCIHRRTGGQGGHSGDRIQRIHFPGRDLRDAAHRAGQIVARA